MCVLYLLISCTAPVTDWDRPSVSVRPQKMFVVPKGKMFREYFDEQLAMFRKVTEDMPEEKVVRMVRDPLCKLTDTSYPV